MVTLEAKDNEAIPAVGTVFVIDDDPDVRNAVVMLVRSVGLTAEAFSSAVEFLGGYDSARPGCLVLDVRLPGMSGLEMQRALEARGQAPPIIFVTAHGEITLATQAIRSGAVDFLQKPFSPQSLLERIHEALSIDAQRRHRRALAADVENRLTSLTERERQIMELLAAGESAKHIAALLSISSKTVDNHRAKILEKMRVENPTQLARLLSARD